MSEGKLKKRKNKKQKQNKTGKYPFIYWRLGRMAR